MLHCWIPNVTNLSARLGTSILAVLRELQKSPGEGRKTPHRALYLSLQTHNSELSEPSSSRNLLAAPLDKHPSPIPCLRNEILHHDIIVPLKPRPPGEIVCVLISEAEEGLSHVASSRSITWHSVPSIRLAVCSLPFPSLHSIPLHLNSSFLGRVILCMWLLIHIKCIDPTLLLKDMAYSGAFLFFPLFVLIFTEFSDVIKLRSCLLWGLHKPCYILLKKGKVMHHSQCIYINHQIGSVCSHVFCHYS